MEMQQKPVPQIPPPPGVINVLKSGLDVISTHLSLLLLPLALDALLWFAPRLSVKDLFLPLVEEAVRINATKGLPMESLQAAQNSGAEFLGHFNLFGLLRTFPVGVSSLLSGKMPVQTPFGAQEVIEVSAGGFFLLVFGLIPLGWILGGLYFNSVSRVTGDGEAKPGAGRAVGQTLLFSIVFTMFTFMVGVPVMLVLIVINQVNASLMQVAVFVLALFSAWIIVPVFFAPHGMYLRGQNALYSIYASLRMARFTLPTSSMFILAVFVISQGLNYLWKVPSDNSWMMVVGIAGHAFITTALLAASFIYYRDMNAWLELVFERLKPGPAASQT
jgi:hypothetical protein